MGRPSRRTCYNQGVNRPPASLTPAQVERLCRVIAARPRGLLTDVDGTISRIAPTPAEAVVTSAVQSALRAIHKRFDLVAIVSGRGVDDLRRMVGVPELVYVGNHGVEFWEQGRLRRLPEIEEYLPVVEAARNDLAPRLSPEMVLEYKRAGLSIHYRRSPAPTIARRQILAAVAESGAARRLRLTEGKMVIELRPPVAADKGTALEALVQEKRLRSVLYMGDDRTDLDAFRAAHRLGDACLSLTIAVVSEEAGNEVSRAADLTLPGVDGAQALLDWLACLPWAPGHGGPPTD